jgi:Holliday junction resolvasome RuvABC DNA-binding subunit
VVVKNEGVSEEYESISALLSLGYSRSEAIVALNGIDKGKSLEETVTLALKSLMRG